MNVSGPAADDDEQTFSCVDVHHGHLSEQVSDQPWSADDHVRAQHPQVEVAGVDELPTRTVNACARSALGAVLQGMTEATTQPVATEQQTNRLNILDLAVPERDTMRLTVVTAPTTHALAQLLSVVRGRGGNVLDLRWQVTSRDGEGVAALLIEIKKTRQRHLQAAIARSVCVRDVTIL